MLSSPVRDLGPSKAPFWAAKPILMIKKHNFIRDGTFRKRRQGRVICNMFLTSKEILGMLFQEAKIPKTPTRSVNEMPRKA